jgi:class 3 adenylate cyclase/tetratricopeptide (TPR) repeat protein
MEQYERAFRENAIDEHVLHSLTADDLKELGIASIGHRRKLLDALSELRTQMQTSRQATTPIRSAHTTATLSDTKAERRQVAVLFADLCGFTEMSREVDAEDVLAMLDRYFEQTDRIVEQHGGHIDKHVGDCVMAVFGAPFSHGNDVERALRAALAIRDAMPRLSRTLSRPLSVHVGIAGGQVVASGAGSDAHREYTVTGETVNLASRLTDAAGQGEILISEAVWRAVADRIDCAERGAIVVKGFAQALPAWCLAGFRHTGLGRPFIGRRDELLQFRAVLESCRETGRGQVVQVRGEAGIGKTRIVEEFQREASERGFACHGAVVLDFGASTGRNAIRSLVRSVLALDDASDASTRDADKDAGAAAIAHATAHGLIDAGEALFLSDLAGVPQTASERAVYEAMDNAMRVSGRANVLTGLVQRASRLQALVLTVEDIHWSDGPTLSDLAQVAATAAQCPAVLVLTTRVQGDPLDETWRAAAGAPYARFDVGPLNVGDARLMAESFPGATADLAERCIERASGNPLFLEQLLRNAEETAGTGVPGSVQSLVQARLDRLDPADKTVLQAASVLGQRFEQDAVVHLLDGADAKLESLVESLLLRHQGSGFLFHHALIRDAIYDGLLNSRRRELHRRAAHWYSERDLVLRAEHLDRAADADAARAYCDAARSLAAAYRYEFALRLVDRGLQLAAPADAERVALECLRGNILYDMGDMTQALGAFETALAAATTDTERCHAWIGCATVKRVIDHLDSAWTDLDHAQAAATAAGLLREEARIHFLRGNLCFPRADSDGCLREHQRALALARETHDHEQEAAALGGVGDAEYMRGHMMSAYDAFSRCIRLCQSHGFGRIEVANLPMRAITAWLVGKVRAGLDDALASVAAAEKVGHRRALAIAHHSAYNCLHDLAEWDRAMEHVGPALQCALELGARRFEGEALLFRAELHRAAGRRREALDDIEKALAISRETGMAYLGASCLGILAHTTDNVAVFETALADGEAVLAAGAVSHNYYLFRRDAIDACIDRGLWDAAEAHAVALDDYACRELSPFAVFVVARARALIAYGKGVRDAALLAELEKLREEGNNLGFVYALPTIDAAIAGETIKPG